ncbi:hypothetical protein BT93_F3259 [Corymbia citriodora subsp. variegata]|nr:hypothetical protein BT93_F3259 [Corymbia citriodora subsp. variegata]
MLNQVEFHYYPVGLHDLVHTFSNELFRKASNSEGGCSSPRDIIHRCNLSSQPNTRHIAFMSADPCLLDIRFED